MLNTCRCNLRSIKFGVTFENCYCKFVLKSVRHKLVASTLKIVLFFKVHIKIRFFCCYFGRKAFLFKRCPLHII